ncbi:MAG: hypothetical protein IKE11_11325, partial [Clostridia bacterium]|nr:hypothetical protein [Clostridia bacterium]
FVLSQDQTLEFNLLQRFLVVWFFLSLGRFAFRVVVSQLLRINLACLLFSLYSFQGAWLSWFALVSRDSYDSIPPPLSLVNPFFCFFAKIFFRVWTSAFWGGVESILLY